MKVSFLKIGVVVMLLFVFALNACAEEEKAGGMTVGEIRDALGMSVYVQGGYTYNFEEPDNQTNELRVFDHKSNSFTVDLAQLIFVKDAPMAGVGYKLKLSAGETAKFIHAAGLGDDEFDLTEAYIDYLAPVGSGLKFRFGKFVTMHGAEVIEAKDNMNYSRGLLFNFAIPFTHTGLMTSYSFSDKLSASFSVVNGWDNFDDEGSSKTVGLSVSAVPSDKVSLVLNVMNGRELAGDISSTRFLADFVGTVKPVDKLTLVVNTDYATQKDAAADGSDVKWYGIAGFAKYDFSDLFSAAVRLEYFKDEDGARTGTEQSVKEITLTPELRIARNLLIRPEYRHDWSNEQVFDSGTSKSQDTIALGVMYTW